MSEQSQENGQQVRGFDPSKHLIQLKSRQGSQDYLPVQWRIVGFREAFPQGTIDTEEVVVDLDREVEIETYVWNNERRKSEKVTRKARGYARFRAVVTDGKGGRATGTKSENAANFQDYIEKAETGSVGRALAALGFGTAYAAEFDEGPRIVDSPVEREGTRNATDPTEQRDPAQNSPEPHPTPTNAAPSRAPSETAQSVNITEQQISSIRKLCQHLGKSEPEGLTSATYEQGKKWIIALTAEYKESRAGITPR